MKQKKRLIFMGTPKIAEPYLKKLMDQKYDIIAVYTQPPRKKGRGMQVQNSAIHNLALKNKLTVSHPENFQSLDEINKFKKLKPDIVIVMGYGILLPKKIITIPKYGCFNIHLSLLPKWRGAAPIEHSIINGETKTGVTIFQIEEKLDSGPIIASREIEISNNTTKEKLTKDLNIIGIDLLIKALLNLFKNKISKINQDNSKATYATKISSNQRKIDFNKDVFKVYNLIRAFSIKPYTWFIFNKQRFNIIKCSMKNSKNSKTSIILNDQFHIGCLNGKIIPEIIQREGKKPMDIKDFLKGFNFKIGQKINA